MAHAKQIQDVPLFWENFLPSILEELEFRKNPMPTEVICWGKRWESHGAYEYASCEETRNGQADQNR
jgi:hypothetical protein